LPSPIPLSVYRDYKIYNFFCRLGAEIGFEDPNLTAAVSENLKKVAKPRQISCA
jgi:hypothetical protein